MTVKSGKKLFGFSFLFIVVMLTFWNGQAMSGEMSEIRKKIGIQAVPHAPILEWDPSAMTGGGIAIFHNVYETLFRYNPETDKAEPLLATEYSKSDDGMQWTFQIRKGVKFHDGTDLNAQAVKFSIDRTMELGKGMSFIWGPVESIEVPDEYTVRFNLKYPVPLDIIASAGYAAYIMSPSAVKAHDDSWLSSGNECGTGPYILERTRMGEEVVLAKFDGYWKGWEGKHLERIVFKKIPETSARRHLVEVGDCDISNEPVYEDISAVEKNPDVNVVINPSYQNLFLCFNTLKPPLDNKLVRKALSYAFPYESVIKYAVSGYATQAKGPIPKGIWGRDESLFQYTFDLDKARDLLKQAGLADKGFTLELTYASGDEAEKKVAEIFKSELTKLNINLEIRAMPWDSQWEKAKANDPQKRQDIYTLYWWPDHISPISWFYPMFHSQEQIFFNLSYYNNKTLDKTMEEANATSGISRDESEKIYHKAQKILIEDAPAIFAYDRNYICYVHNSLKGFKDNPAYPIAVYFYDTYRD